MAYFAPYIGPQGLFIPTYQDILEDLLSAARRIYGQDIYLEPDSQDYEMISAFALKTHDTMKMLALIYNNRSTPTAVGSALDSLLKLNGLKRKSSSHSTCQIELHGTVGAEILNGIVEDEVGNRWLLPEKVVFDTETVEVSVRCEKLGAVEALPGVINKIATPTKGWISVINKVAAIPGKPVEKDSAVRARQAISVANPSQTLLEGTVGAIASLEGVTRYRVYDNDTNITDENGIPGHTISAVVEGGLDEEIAQMINLHKGPGGGTFGNTSVEIKVRNDPELVTIRFHRPSYVTVDSIIYIRKLEGYSTDLPEKIETQVQDYLNELNIGGSIRVSSVWGAALQALSSLKNPNFAIDSITVGKHGESQSASDVYIKYNEVAKAGSIEVRVV